VQDVLRKCSTCQTAYAVSLYFCTGSFRGGKGDYPISGGTYRKSNTIEDCMLLCIKYPLCKQILFKDTHSICFTFMHVVSYESKSGTAGWNTNLYQKM